ncbi:hypothetical protein FE257_005662 [Aspergillus nanangensis]|uniref:Major facilitator superfamily (MFS) profile domain-containing protein n=1 Tax=Aspergillus nanangensis TaxID=2582783 RepID=A0AAD4CAF1_ASPNN|nr:hypothetical protein FE257_005662 [Aspergillus nanangensis]
MAASADLTTIMANDKGIETSFMAETSPHGREPGFKLNRPAQGAPSELLMQPEAVRHLLHSDQRDDMGHACQLPPLLAEAGGRSGAPRLGQPRVSQSDKAVDGPAKSAGRNTDPSPKDKRDEHSEQVWRKGPNSVTMSSVSDSEKKRETGLFPTAEHYQNAPDASSPEPNMTREERIKYERRRASPDTGIARYFSWMGDLPEWKLNGKHLVGRTLNWAIGFIASCGFLMFGYDQGVLSALLTLDSFQETLSLMTPREKSNALCWLDEARTVPHPTHCQGDANTQAAGVAIYQIGCWMGSLVILAYGEKWGRKSSTFWGSLIMIIGTIMQAACFEYGLFVAGRVVGGIGNGMVTSTIPTWQSECARPHQRGVLIMLSGALISAGIMIAYWVDYGFYFLEGSVRWRFPLMFQSFFTIIVMIGLLYLPDSPRWLIMKGRHTEARGVTARLVDKPEDDPEVEEELRNINDALEVQSKGGPFRYRELLTNGPSQNFRRATLGIVAQFFQQICGINLITYYATFLFENSLGFGPAMSRLLAACNGTEYFLASLVALPLIERVGRRKLMLVGAFGMMASMAILAGTVSTGVVSENGAPQLDTRYGVTATVFLFVFNSFFAIGWLGMTWLYPAEITNLRIRIQANALSTSSNWMSNFLIVMITPPAFANLGYQTYIMFAVFNAALIPCVYLFFPETKGRTLEEMDIVFASASAQGINPVKQSLNMPKLTGQALDDEIMRYFGPGSDEEVPREK